MHPSSPSQPQVLHELEPLLKRLRQAAVEDEEPVSMKQLVLPLLLEQLVAIDRVVKAQPLLENDFSC